LFRHDSTFLQAAAGGTVLETFSETRQNPEYAWLENAHSTV
jgi:hypothetical protein